MQLKLHSKGAVEVSVGENKMYFLFSEGGKGKLDGDEDFLVGPVEDKDVFYGPGEYEVQEISVIGVETKEETVGIADLYKVLAGDVNYLFVVNPPAKMLKSDWDQVGEVDVVVFDPTAQNGELARFLKKVEPFVIIATGDAEQSEIEKIVGQQIASSDKKFKFSAKDFKEETALSVHILK